MIPDYSGCKGIYIEEFFQPSQLRNLMVGGLQGEEWKFIQKYLKKNIPKCRSQISGYFRNHFARENGVCEISQTLKRAAKYFRNNKLNSQGCEIGFHLEVLSVPACGIYRVTSGGNPQHCAKRLRNSRNKRLISQHFGVIFLQWL